MSYVHALEQKLNNLIETRYPYSRWLLSHRSLIHELSITNRKTYQYSGFIEDILYDNRGATDDEFEAILKKYVSMKHEKIEAGSFIFDDLRNLIVSSHRLLKDKRFNNDSNFTLHTFLQCYVSSEIISFFELKNKFSSIDTYGNEAVQAILELEYPPEIKNIITSCNEYLNSIK